MIKFDPRKNIAKDSKHYQNAWNAHITELTNVLVESNIPYSEWDVILLPLRNAVSTATDKLVAEGHLAENRWDCGACTEAIGAHTYDDGCRLVAKE